MTDVEKIVEKYGDVKLELSEVSKMLRQNLVGMKVVGGDA